MPGKHSAKQKRQAQHIIDSAQKRGMSNDDAERMAWATVNKQRSAKKGLQAHLLSPARRAAHMPTHNDYGSDEDDTSETTVHTPRAVGTPAPPSTPAPRTISMKKPQMARSLNKGLRVEVFSVDDFYKAMRLLKQPYRSPQERKPKVKMRGLWLTKMPVKPTKKVKKSLDKAVLSAKKRNKLKDSSFALPGRRYPIEDAAHARNALARVSQHGSSEEKKTVRAKVHHKYPDIGKSEHFYKVSQAAHAASRQAKMSGSLADHAAAYHAHRKAARVAGHMSGGAHEAKAAYHAGRVAAAAGGYRTRYSGQAGHVVTHNNKKIGAYSTRTKAAHAIVMHATSTKKSLKESDMEKADYGHGRGNTNTKAPKCNFCSDRMFKKPKASLPGHSAYGCSTCGQTVQIKKSFQEHAMEKAGGHPILDYGSVEAPHGTYTFHQGPKGHTPTSLHKPMSVKFIHGKTGKTTSLGKHPNAIAAVQAAKKHAATFKKSLDVASDVMKSITQENVMENDINFEELFSDELAKSEAADRPLINCPHCDEPITKSQVLAKSKKRNKHTVAAQNNDGKNARGGKDGGHNSATPTRPKGSSDKYGPSMPGSYARKSDASSDGDSDSVSKSDSLMKCPKCGDMAKAGEHCNCGHVMAKSISSANAPLVRGSEYVQYVDTGEDQRTADLIASGMLGQGAIGRPPVDKT